MASPLPEDDFGPDLEQLGAIGGLKTRGEGYIPKIQSAYGSIIQNAPDYQYFTAPLSNQGRATATYGGQNNLVVAPNTPIRVVNNATGEVIYSGTGYEGAQAAIEAAKSLSASAGKKADWDIQVTRPGGTKFESVSTDRPDSALGEIGKIAGTILPLAMIPLTMGASAPLAGLGAAGNVALGAGVGAASAGLKGQNILKGGLMGGLTSAGGQFLSGPLKGVGLGADAARAVGTGIGATAGGLATGQGLENSLLGGLAAGGTTYLGSKLFSSELDPTQKLVDQNVRNALADLDAGIFDVTAPPVGLESNLANISRTAAGQIADMGLPTTSFSVPSAGGATPVASDYTITANTSAPASVAGSTPSFAVNVAGKVPAVGGEDAKEIEVFGRDEGFTQAEGPGFAVDTSGLTNPNISVEGQRQTPAAEDNSSFAVNVPTPSVDEIIVTGDKKPVVKDTNDLSVPIDVGNTLKFITQPEVTDDIIVNAKKQDEVPYVDPLTPRIDVTETLSDVTKPEIKKDSTLDEISKYMRLLGLGVGLAGNLFGGGGGGKSPGKYSSTGRLSSTFTDKLPTPGQNGAFTVGGLSGTAADRTLAARPVTDWYRYGMGPAMDIPAGADLSRATSPYAGYGPGTLGEETFKAVSGIPEQPVGMAHGGDMGYSRGSSRESFAVEGPGTGRSDDIPAVLSDGEYVIDAETVALLGDGSSKAGAKKLDQMRVSIRKHKGKNLAKGKFSVNAKRPEAYMSGGRI